MQKQVVRGNVVALPYSLHDAVVLAAERSGDRLTLRLQSGFICTAAPYEQVDGSVLFEGLDLDFCAAYLLEYPDVLCGNYGRLSGEKLRLEEFVTRYANARFEILDETYGFNQTKLDGFLSLAGRIFECRLELCHLGNMSYLIGE